MANEQIQCCCGATALEFTGAPRVHLYCHCRDCQRVHAAAYVPAILFLAEDIHIVRGQPTEWRLRTATRWTCPECGTRLLSQGNERVWGVMATLFPPDRFQPSLHIHCESAVLPVRDSLPHYSKLPARFGGSDELVDW